jgi:hypothetical protein
MAVECELLATCKFFNDKMANVPVTAEIMKASICRSDNSQCARYLVFKTMGRERVPGDLFPNEMERARTIVRK